MIFPTYKVIGIYFSSIIAYNPQVAALSQYFWILLNCNETNISYRNIKLTDRICKIPYKLFELLKTLQILAK